jgi:putative addiction module component (TIGR02574 family)
MLNLSAGNSIETSSRTRTSVPRRDLADYDTLLSDASQLPLDARIQLIEALWETVPEDALPPLSDEWRREINRRSAEYDAG